jgi:hypothetical protein
MTKLVINTNYGGFGLSEVAIKRAQEISNDPNWGGVRFTGNRLYDEHITLAVPRTDPILVQVVEELGRQASGKYSTLEVVDVPPGSKYRIQEYDGMEWIEYPEDIEWAIAP